VLRGAARSTSLATFIGGVSGDWAVVRLDAVCGDPLEPADRLIYSVGSAPAMDAAGVWILRGVVSNTRYTTAREAAVLTQKQPSLGRPEATCAALIPIRKSDAWWALAQDERRAIYEERSQHTSIGLEYLPRIARRLHHSRDLGEPFDFLTWFEYAPEHSDAFEELVKRLRDREEWRFVEREVDIRLVRAER
jgi:chlorite dismutase